MPWWQGASVRTARLTEFEWMFDLIHSDRAVRQAAIDRQRAYDEEWSRHNDRSNDIYFRAGRTFAPKDPVLRAELDRTWAARREVGDKMVLAPILHYVSGGPDSRDRDPWARHAVLYLVWETRFPAEWAAVSKGWHTKKHILRVLAQRGPTPDTHADLVGLLAAAVTRSHRCEDGGYARLARRLDRPSVVDIVTAGEQADGEHVRLRAGYVRWVVDHPHRPVTLASWRAWLQENRTTTRLS